MTPILAAKIEHWPIERLIPYARNARTHSAAQVEQIARSIRTFGFTNPILVDGAQGILAGHGRLDAAKLLKLALVPVIVLDHLSEAERRAYILADNKLALNAGWDDEVLEAELAALDGVFDLSVLGFSEKELEALLGGESAGSQSLAERFGVPPFSVLDARQGYWQDRKQAWLALGIQSELGRGDTDAVCPGGSRLPLDRPSAFGGGQQDAAARLNGLTWGNSAPMRHPSLNYYREKNRQA